MPEQPEPSSTALGEIARDAADRATPADAATVDFAAVTSGPEAGGKRRRTLRVGTWLSLAWMTFVIGGAILAPYLPLDDPEASITQIARRGPFAKAGTAPGHLLGGDPNGRDMLSRLLWGVVAPIVLAWMIKKTVEMRATQSATGILYALCVAILLGEGAALYLKRMLGLYL